LDASAPRNPVTALGSGPPDSSSFAAAGWLSTVVEHPEARSAAARAAAATPANILFRKFIIISLRSAGFAKSIAFLNRKTRKSYRIGCSPSIVLWYNKKLGAERR
jgi:hypothetical protein